MWAEFFRAPDISIALMDKWDDKLEKLSHAIADEKKREESREMRGRVGEV